MTANRPASKPAAPAGQCARCRFALTQVGASGDHFLRCAHAEDDPALTRYPRLPVVDCPGFEAEDSDA